MKEERILVARTSYFFVLYSSSVGNFGSYLKLTINPHAVMHHLTDYPLVYISTDDLVAVN